MRALALIALAIVSLSVNAAHPDARSAADQWNTIAALSFPHDTRTPFRETRSSKLLRKPVQRAGMLWIEESGDFVMQLQGPRPEERRLSDKRLQLTRKKKTRSVVLDRSKGAHQLLLSIVDVLEGNVERLQATFDIREQPIEKQIPEGQKKETAQVTQLWSVTLTPIDPKLRKTLQKLELSGNATALQSLRAERNPTSWQEIRILSPTNQPATKIASD